MFHSGFSELILIFIVAILVLGPKRLPEAATQLGTFFSRLKKFWKNIQISFNENTQPNDDNNSST